MGEVYTYSGTHLTTIRDGEVELTQSAELGQVASGRVTIRDEAGTLSIVGQKNFSVTQSGCSVPLIFRGFVGDRSYSRGDANPKVSASRDIAASLLDLNAMLGFRMFAASSNTGYGKRPTETVAARGAWLMASSSVSGLFVDNGRCSFPSTKGMDAADYRNQFPGDVLADMALAAGGYNYHVNDWGSGPELTFRDDNASTADSSTLRISNDLADASSVTLNPFKDATLERSPGEVYSKLAYTYAKGTVLDERTATATTFNGERGGTASNSNVKTSAKAVDETTSLLWQHSTESDVIACTVLVTDAQVNLILPGQRIQAKFTHLNTEGYGSFTWFRVLERTVRPIVAEGTLYELPLKLSPQEAGPAAAAIVQSAVDRGAEGGLTLTLPNPVTVGNYLVVMISGAKTSDPGAPNTDPALARWGAGAWTRFNGATITNSGGTTPGISAYYKVADATSQSGFLSVADAVAGVWELSGANPPGATVTGVTAATGGTNYDIGAAGVVAAGTVAIVGWTMWDLPFEWSWDRAIPPTYPWDNPNPPPNIAAGWNLRISKWAYDHYSITAFVPAAPWSVIADATGTGASLTARITPGESHLYGALKLLIPPL